MKNIVKFIKESVDTYRLTKVVAEYLVQPKELIFQAPETYSESDIQIYVEDKYLEELPAGQSFANKINNIKYIIEFDNFDMEYTSDNNVKENLINILKSAESNNDNEWPLEIQFNEDNLEYRK